MAVPEGKRTKPKTEFHTKAIELADYTATICNNNKIFPKRDRWMISNRMVNASITILVNVVKANNIYPTTKEDYHERKALQIIARDTTVELLALLDLAYKRYSIESKRMEHWTRLIYNERSLILNWIKSDKDRFKNLK